MPITVGGVTVYDIPELSKMLNVTPLTLANYIRKRKLKAQKVGRRWLITEENLRDFLNAKQEEKKGK